MQHTVMAIAGLVCLLISVVSVYKLAPRDGKPGFAWLQIELIEISVASVLVSLLAVGLALFLVGLG